MFHTPDGNLQSSWAKLQGWLSEWVKKNNINTTWTKNLRILRIWTGHWTANSCSNISKVSLSKDWFYRTLKMRNQAECVDFNKLTKWCYTLINIKYQVVLYLDCHLIGLRVLTFNSAIKQLFNNNIIHADNCEICLKQKHLNIQRDAQHRLTTKDQRGESILTCHSHQPKEK